MRDKHIKVERDSQLLKSIKTEIKTQLIIDEAKASMLIAIKFLIYVTIIGVTYYGLYNLVNPLAFLMCYIMYGFIGLLFAFNFSHDLSHNTIFKNNKINNVLYILSFTIVGAHAEAWKKRHISSHHFAPNVEGYDSDLKITKLIRVVPNSDYFWFHKYQHIYGPIAYATYSLFWIFIKDFVILFSDKETEGRLSVRYHLSFWTQKLFYVFLSLLLPLYFSFQSWQTVILGFVIMHLTLSIFLLFTFFMTHHVESTLYPKVNDNGYINTSWLMNQIKSSNDMHPFSEIANFIFGGFNNHIAHHLFPHIHHVHYPKLNKVLYNVLIDNGVIPNQTTYFGGVVSHLKLLKRMGRS